MTRAVWHLAIETLTGRRGRTALLVIAVALATVLTVAVAALIGTLRQSVSSSIGFVAGLSDVAIVHRFDGYVKYPTLETVREWEEVETAVGRHGHTATIRVSGRTKPYVLFMQGVEPEVEQRVKPRHFLEGRNIESDDEVALEQRVAEKLKANVGDEIDIIRFGDPLSLKIVGVFERESLDILQRRLALVTLNRAYDLSGYEGALKTIEIKLTDGVDAASFIEDRQGDLPPEYSMKTSASAGAGVQRGLKITDLLMVILIEIASFSAGFSIVASLTTNVMQRLREMAILRCIGAARWQLAASQVVAGLVVAVMGAAVGAPIGLAGAYWVYWRNSENLPGGFDPNPRILTLAVIGSVVAGLLGGLYPAVVAATARPMQAMTARAKRPKWRAFAVCTLIGLLLVSAAPLATTLDVDGESVVWWWVYCGLPLTFLGWFMLSIPLLWVLSHSAAPIVSACLGLPRALLGQTLRATPFRYALTGGALTIGLALLVTIWMVGRSFMGGWFNNLKMPDAFVHINNDLISRQKVDAVADIEGVEHMCPVVLFPVNAKEAKFGLKDIHPTATMFVSSDVHSFFDMTDIDWHQGDEAKARERLKQGRAVVVSKEYYEAFGLGEGGTITLDTNLGPVAFDVVGVIGSRGLDVGVSFFGLRDKYSQASVSCLFGTRQDAERYFASTNTRLILLGFAEDADEAAIHKQIQALGMRMHTSTKIRTYAHKWMERLMSVASTVAFWSMVIACIGVANLIIAEIAARRHEFGVLRAIGGSSFLLARLVAGQTIVIAGVGCVTGTALGLEMALMEKWIHLRLAGIVWSATIPWDVIAYGCLAVIGSALLAAAPALWRLVRTQPRELLAAAT